MAYKCKWAYTLKSVVATYLRSVSNVNLNLKQNKELKGEVLRKRTLRTNTFWQLRHLFCFAPVRHLLLPVFLSPSLHVRLFFSLAELL